MEDFINTCKKFLGYPKGSLPGRTFPSPRAGTFEKWNAHSIVILFFLFLLASTRYHWKEKIYLFIYFSAGALCWLMPLEWGSHEISVSQIRLKWVLIL
jgi:hypothetical protein